MSIEEGRHIAIRFSEALTGDVSGNEACFTVTVPVYDMVPGGSIEDVTVPVESVSQSDELGDHVLLLNFASGNLECIRNAAAPITVSYAGGTLAGTGGPVDGFSVQFTATDLIPKNHQHDMEHITLSVQAAGVLTKVNYSDTADNEHIEISVTAVGVLTHIDDL